jgi:hypothetical protein
MGAESLSRKVFQRGFIISKISLITILLVYAYKNLYINFISKEPKKFLNESLLLGSTLSSSLLVILFFRNASTSFSLNVALISFMTFFFINVLMEISGQNLINNSDTKSLTDVQKTQLGHINIIKQLDVFKGSVFVLGIILISLALLNRDMGPGLSILLFESVLFGVVGLIPGIYLSKNRGQKVNNNVLVKHFVLFAFVHIICQLGGLYTYDNK